MQASEINKIILELESDILRLKERLAEKQTVLKFMKLRNRSSRRGNLTKDCPPPRPTKVRDLKAMKLPAAVTGLLSLNPSKLFTPAMVVKGLRQAGHDRLGKNPGVNVNTALRRIEKYGWIKRRLITREMKLWDPSGKTTFAYFFEAPTK